MLKQPAVSNTHKAYPTYNNLILKYIFLQKWTVLFLKLR